MLLLLVDLLYNRRFLGQIQFLHVLNNPNALTMCLLKKLLSTIQPKYSKI